MKRIAKENEWRCQLSEEGKATVRGDKIKERLGTAWSHAEVGGYVRVVWDGTTEPHTYDSTLIERIAS